MKLNVGYIFFVSILKSYVSKARHFLEQKNISLSSRVLSAFADYLPILNEENDDLSDLGRMVNDKDANIIDLQIFQPLCLSC